MKTNYQLFTSHFPKQTIHVNFFTEDSETITFICTESNRIEYFKTVTAACECCTEFIDYQEDADYIINHLSEDDLHLLIIEIANQSN